jgi:hypothetical protein
MTLEPLASGMPSSSLRFEDFEVAVTAPERGDLGWLEAFLACGFEPIAQGAGDRRVVLTVDAAAYDRLLSRGRPGQGAQVEGFAGDAKPVRLERWPSNASDAVFRDLRRAFFYVVSADVARVEIVARERTPKCRTRLMRVVRELAMDRVVATGGILVHGSAVRVDGGVVVMCGPKRSGKTTLLMSLLAIPGTRYVANDRCVLRPTESGVGVRGLPTLVSIRCDTLAHFPAARWRLGGIRPDLATGPSEPTSFSLSPPEFCELMGDCPRESGGPLLALIFPRITRDPAPLTLERVAAPEALARFREGLFRAGHASPLGEAFASKAALAASSAHAAERRIAESVPAFDCRLGGGGAPGAEACRGLLERVSDLRRAGS